MLTHPHEIPLHLGAKAELSRSLGKTQACAAALGAAGLPRRRDGSIPQGLSPTGDTAADSCLGSCSPKALWDPRHTQPPAPRGRQWHGATLLGLKQKEGWVLAGVQLVGVQGHRAALHTPSSSGRMGCSFFSSFLRPHCSWHHHQVLGLAPAPLPAGTARTHFRQAALQSPLEMWCSHLSSNQ